MEKNMQIRLLMITLAVLFTLTICGTVSAATYVTRTDLTFSHNSAAPGDQITLTADVDRLWLGNWENVPAGITVTFRTLGGSVIGTATTDSNGIARCPYTVTSNDDITIRASIATQSFGGNNYLGSQDDEPLDVYGTTTSLTVNQTSTNVGNSVTLSSRLRQGSSNLEGRTIHFMVDGVQVGTGTTASNGWAYYTYTPLTSGTKNIQAVFYGNLVPEEWSLDPWDYYRGSSSTTQTLTVNANSTNLAVDPASGYKDEQTTLRATLTSGGNPLSGKTISFLINGNPVGSGTTDANGVATYVYTITQNVGTYLNYITAVFAGDSQYVTSNGANTLTVDPIPTSITVNSPSGYKGDTVEIVATLVRQGTTTGIAGKTIYFTINGATYTALTDANGVARLSYLIELNSGSYSISANNAADDKYASSSGTGTLTVNAIPTSLTVSPNSGYKGDDTTLTARLWDTVHNIAIVGKQVDFYVNGVFQGSGTTDANGVATWTYAIVENVGNYLNYITAVFAADSQYAGANGANSLTVTATSTSLTVSPNSGYKGDDTTLTARLWDTVHNIAIVGKQVDFYLNGVFQGSGTTDANGYATWTYNIAQDVGTYLNYITAVFAADTQYTSANGANSLTVNAIPTSLTVDPVIGYKGDSVTLRATLWDTFHNMAVAGKQVNFYVHGVLVGSDTTDSNGVATCTYTIVDDVGSYVDVIGAVFNADTQYAGANGNNTLTVGAVPTSLTVSPISGYKGDDITLTARLWDTFHNMAVAGKQVNFYVHGVLVGSGTTDSNGVATCTYTIVDDVGSYVDVIGAVFNADTQYAGANGNNTLTVGAIPTSLTVNPVSGYKGDSITLTARLWDTVHNMAISGKAVDFYVNNVLAGSGITDANGYATWTYTIVENVGTYLNWISAVFNADTQYAGANGVNSLTVNGIPTSLTVNNVTGNKGMSLLLSSTLKNSNGAPISGKTITFRVNGVIAGSSVTDANGVATLLYDIGLIGGTYNIDAEFAADTTYTGSTGEGTLKVLQSSIYVLTTVSKKNPTVGDIIKITFKLGNKGPDSSEGVVFTYVIPEGMEFVSIETEPGYPEAVYDPATRTITWNLGDVPVLDPWFEVNLRVLKAGNFNINPAVTTVTYDPTLGTSVQTVSINAVNAANAASKTKKIPLQHTGIPLAGLVLAILAVLGGLATSKKF